MRDRGLAWGLPAAAAAGLLAFWARPQPRPRFDAQSFGLIPVLEGGRVKPMDSFARNALLMLRGRQTLGWEGRTLSAAEWLLEAAARPERADAMPVFLIDDPDLLGLLGKGKGARRHSFRDLAPHAQALAAQAEAASRVEAPARDRFQSAVVRLQERITLYRRIKNTFQPEGTEDFPGEVEGYGLALARGVQALQAHRAGGPHDRNTLDVLAGFLQRYESLARAAAFRALPPLEGEDPDAWETTGGSLLFALETGRPHPAIAPLAGAVAAYAGDDPAGFSRALADHLAWTGKVRPEALRRARAEARFNRLAPFTAAQALYLLALLAAFASWLRPGRPLEQAGLRVALLAWIVHTAGLAARIWLQGRPPVTNLYSSAVFVGWAAAGLGLVLERLQRGGLGTAAGSALGAATLVIAAGLSSSGDTLEMMRAVLDTNFWLATHVVAVTVGYSSTFLAGLLAHLYILRGALTGGLLAREARALARMTYGVVCFSLFFSFAGTVLGGIWADQSWGRFWGWDPKENGALLIVLWNASILHARWAGLVRERGLMVLAVFGGIVTSLSWFGVNMLGIGLHAYGFMDKAFVWLAAFVTLQLAVMAVGLLPARYWRSPALPG